MPGAFDMMLYVISKREPTRTWLPASCVVKFRVRSPFRTKSASMNLARQAGSC
jgi:hypothetical protein